MTNSDTMNYTLNEENDTQIYYDVLSCSFLVTGLEYLHQGPAGLNGNNRRISDHKICCAYMESIYLG